MMHFTAGLIPDHPKELYESVTYNLPGPSLRCCAFCSPPSRGVCFGRSTVNTDKLQPQRHFTRQLEAAHVTTFCYSDLLHFRCCRGRGGKSLFWAPSDGRLYSPAATPATDSCYPVTIIPLVHRLNAIPHFTRKTSCV